jgi:hypothetical protein
MMLLCTKKCVLRYGRQCKADGPCRQVQTLTNSAFNLGSNSVRSSSFTIPPDSSFRLEAWFLKITSTKSQGTS